MLTFGKFNLFEQNCQAIVNPVNCVGVMGKGLALEFKRRFPENFKAYETACMVGLVFPGNMLVVKSGNMVVDGEVVLKYVINFPTKNHWRDESRLEYISSGLQSLVEEIENNKIRSIAIPALGCGLGGLDWKLVKPLIEQYLWELNCSVLVCDPQ